MNGIDDLRLKAAALLRDSPDACPTCWGSGKLANDDEQSPWPLWDALEGVSRLSVTMGLVYPVPCPDCKGSGKKAPPPPPIDVDLVADTAHQAARAALRLKARAAARSAPQRFDRAAALRDIDAAAAHLATLRQLLGVEKEQ